MNATPSPAPEPVMYSVRAATAASGMSRSRLYELARNGQLEMRKDNRRVLVVGSILRGFLAGLPVMEAA